MLSVVLAHWTGATTGASALSSAWRQGPTSMGTAGGSSSCGSRLQVQGPYRLYTCAPTAPTLKGAMPSPPRALPPSSSRHVSKPLHDAEITFSGVSPPHRWIFHIYTAA